MDAADVKLNRYRVIKLHWELNGKFNGTIQVDPDIQFAVPADKRPLIRCQYTLDISGLTDEALKLFITAEGIFEVKELPEIGPDGLDRKKLTPITDIMEQKLIASIEKITSDFEIEGMKLVVSAHRE